MRKPMVTRTVVGTNVTALCANLETKQMEAKTFALSGTFKDESKLLKKLQKIYDTNTLKVISITDKQEFNTLYGMDEDYFLKNAVILDPETRKPLTEVASQEA